MKTIRILALSLFTAAAAPASAQDWLAGRDFRTAELLGSPLELQNPNYAVPEWSYGHRSIIASNGLTLYSAGDHTNNYAGPPEVQGWSNAGNLPAVGVNVSASPVVFNFGPGPLAPLFPDEITMHPITGDDVVVRWTAPFAGTFTISSYWEDQDPYGGNGAAGYVVINGAVVASGAWANGSGTGFSDSNRVVSLVPGDTVDFVLDASGDYGYDSTKFNVGIIPEPGACAALLGGAALLALRRRGLARHFFSASHLQAK